MVFQFLMKRLGLNLQQLATNKNKNKEKSNRRKTGYFTLHEKLAIGGKTGGLLWDPGDTDV